jgi:hypothetical protein
MVKVMEQVQNQEPPGRFLFLTNDSSDNALRYKQADSETVFKKISYEILSQRGEPQGGEKSGNGGIDPTDVLMGVGSQQYAQHPGNRTMKRKQAPKKETQQTSPRKKQKKSSKEKAKEPPNTTNKITSTLEEDTLFEIVGESKFRVELFPSLTNLGILFNGKSYSYGESFNDYSEEDLRQYLCQKGIPKVHLLSKKKRKLVELWVRYAHVPVSNLDSGCPQFSDEMIKEALVKELKLKNKGGRFSKSNSEEIGTLQDVRVLLRSVGISGFGRIRNLEMNSQVNLRVWAARSTDPLPEWSKGRQLRKR